MLRKINVTIIGLWCFFSVLGLGFVFLGAGKTRKELIVNAWGFPEKFQWDNFSRVWNSNNFNQFFSIVLSLS